MSSAHSNFELCVESGAGAGDRTIALSGELDSAACGQLAQAFERELAQGRPEKVVLDLQGLRFIDSAGTRMLILLERQAGDRGVALEVVPAPEDVTALLRLAGVAQRVNLITPEPGESDSAEFVERIDMELAREATAPAQARAEIRQVFAQTGDEACLATLVLLTSELVTNAVIHPPPGDEDRVGLRVTIHSDKVQVQVDDPGHGFDVATLVGPTEFGGRGLILVDRASSRWGVGPTSTARGRRFAVWFELVLEAR